MTDALSIVVGLAVGAGSSWLMLWRQPPISLRSTWLVGALAIVALWLWAAAFHAYPQTFGPMIMAMLTSRALRSRRRH